MGNLEILREIANVARFRFLELKDEGRSLAEKVSRGAYGHMSSRMDVEVERAILEFVEDNDFPYDVFTEEAGRISRGYDRVLVVDPVDGSYNAEHGIPFFSVSLAITRRKLSDVEIGFVKNIPTGDEYWAVRGEGAYRNGERLKASAERTNLFVVYLGTNASDRAYEIARRARRVRDLGCASLEMITVAEGIADVFYYSFRRSGALRIVDIAASYLIVREAGGIVLDENFKPLDMDLSFEDRKNVIALRNDSLMEVFP